MASRLSGRWLPRVLKMRSRSRSSNRPGVDGSTPGSRPNDGRNADDVTTPHLPGVRVRVLPAGGVQRADPAAGEPASVGARVLDGHALSRVRRITVVLR